MRALFTGSRKWTRNGIIRSVLKQLVAKYGKENLVIIHGACKRGADFAVDNIAYELGLEQDRYPADWGNLPRWEAGKVRNQQMIDDGKPDLAIAFHMGTGGTQDMIDRALTANLPLAIYDEQGKAERYNWKDL